MPVSTKTIWSERFVWKRTGLVKCQDQIGQRYKHPQAKNNWVEYAIFVTFFVTFANGLIFLSSQCFGHQYTVFFTCYDKPSKHSSSYRGRNHMETIWGDTKTISSQREVQVIGGSSSRGWNYIKGMKEILRNKILVRSSQREHRVIEGVDCRLSLIHSMKVCCCLKRAACESISPSP